MGPDLAQEKRRCKGPCRWHWKCAGMEGFELPGLEDERTRPDRNDQPRSTTPGCSALRLSVGPGRRPVRPGKQRAARRTQTRADVALVRARLSAVERICPRHPDRARTAVAV